MDNKNITTVDADNGNKDSPESLITPKQDAEQLRLIMDALPVLIAYLDDEYCYRFVNKAYADWFGYQIDKIYGRCLRDLIGEEQFARRLAYLERAFQGETVSFDGEIVSLRGERRVRITYVPDMDAHQAVRGVNSLIWDISPAQQTEDSLRKLQHDYVALINSIEGIVWEADAASFQFTFVSAQAEHILGYSVSQWLTEQNFWEKHIHPADSDWVIRSCREATAELRNNDLEYRMIAANGEVIWLRDIVTVRVEDGVAKLRGVMIDITRQKQNEEKLEFLSNYDSLTGLPNRNLFLDRLEQALAYTSWERRPLAVVSISINRFKRINESLGHEAGDKVLQQLADFLRQVMRERDTVARMAGNEFALILTEMSREADIARIMTKIFDRLAEPFSVANHDIMIDISVGISMPPSDGQQADVLLKHAEYARHSVKRQGVIENTYQHYSPDIGHQISDTLAWENAIRRAIDEDEFELYYQPQYDMGSNTIVGIEALLRWIKPDSGKLITPDYVIPLAEESGLIMPLGFWVLERACHDYQYWLTQGIAPPRIAINISAYQFQSPTLVDAIPSILKSHGMTSAQLELELTESVLQTESATEHMRTLANLGMQIAIDDFGTGYSSLNYLKHLPVSKLKMDRSFMRGIPEEEDNRAIIEAIISMGRSLKLQVLAEGVENATQRRYLRTRGCDQAQGFLYARPLPLLELEELLKQNVNA